MAATIYKANFYNEDANAVPWLFEIIDSEAAPETVAIEIETVRGSFSMDMNGSTNELLAGVFATRLTVSLLVEVFIEGILDIIEDATEKRLICKLSRNGVLQYVGFILPDDCSWEDDHYPYSMRIAAADGFQALQAFPYSKSVGTYRYTACFEQAADNSAYTETPLDVCIPPGEGWVLYDHFSNIYGADDIYNMEQGIGSDATSGYVREEVYSIDEPRGVGWIELPNYLWVRSPEIQSETSDTWIDPVTGTQSYRLTRAFNFGSDTLADTFRRALEIVDMQDYMNPVYYQVLMDTYNNDMVNKTDDPSTMIKLPLADAFANSTWADVMQKICEIHGLRIYQAAGTINIEQITARLNSPPTWFQYDYLGDLVGTSTSNEIYVTPVHTIAAGGSYGFQPALREFTYKLDLDTDNYLADTYWDIHQAGSRYVGVVSKSDSYEAFLINIRCRSISRLHQATLNQYSIWEYRAITKHFVIFTIELRLVNRLSGETLIFQPGEVEIDDEQFENVSGYNGTFSATPTGQPYIQVRREVSIGIIELPIYDDKNPIIRDTYVSAKATIPGSAGDQYDLYVSWNFAGLWAPDVEPTALQDPDKYAFFGQSFENSIYIIDSAGEQANKGVNRLYTSRNSVQNTKSFNVVAEWADLVYHKRGIEILAAGTSGNRWIRSQETWGRGAGPYDKALLNLLAEDQMSLRMGPRRIFDGTFLSYNMNIGTLIQRTSFVYLPMRVGVKPETDEWKIEMIRIASTAAPPGVTIDQPVDADNTPVISIDGPGGNQEPPPPPKILETNEVLTSGFSYDECDIINTLEMNIAAGEVVRITNEATGEFLAVELTQDITPASTVMYFSSLLFTVSFPVGSPIALLVENNVPGFPGLPYDFAKDPYSGSSHQFPNYYRLPNPETNSAIAINSRITIIRNGAEMVYKAVPTSPDHWSINYATNSVTFALPLDQERLRIKAR